MIFHTSICDHECKEEYVYIKVYSARHDYRPRESTATQRINVPSLKLLNEVEVFRHISTHILVNLTS